MMGIHHWFLDKIRKKPPVRKPEWQVREPEDRTDPVEHEAFAEEGLDNGGLLMGASIRGKNHAHNGRWREDAFHFDQIGCFTMMAVADGVGSCSLARVGAKIACQTSVDCMKDHLANVADASQLEESVLGECLRIAMLNAIDAIEEEAMLRQTNPGRLSTTLILLLHGLSGSKHLIASLQVGDGVMAAADSSGNVMVLGDADMGEYAGQSVFLTSEGIRENLSQRIIFSVEEDLRHIVLMTDGIADDYFPLEKKLRLFFEDMEHSVLNRKRPIKSLENWIRYDKTGSYDDRTLLLLSFCNDRDSR
ncbi:MAG: hypothetical protein B6245_11005 [Desulfobacteraceae bacterium 4572_88]|nr:MAG: hypothetical protein B6245_11005 [Desulfobacteraceae bacterium 4572_88]